MEKSKNEETVKWQGVYRNSAQKAEDNKSSAYTLLVIGTLGIAAVLLILAGIIPFIRIHPRQDTLSAALWGHFLSFLSFSVLHP